MGVLFFFFFAGVLLEMVIYGPFGNYFDEIDKFISNRHDSNANVSNYYLVFNQS